MAKDDDRQSLDEWLEGKPVHFGVAIASRAALRVLPLLGFGDLPSDKFRNTILLPCFRATATAWFAGCWANRAVGDSWNDAAEAASRASTIVANAASYAAANANLNSASATRAVAEATRAFNATAVAANSRHSDSATAARASYAAANRTSNAAAFWLEIQKDAYTLAQTIEVGRDPSVKAAVLFQEPLWQSSNDHSDIEKAWADLKDELPENEKWVIWTDWYEAILQGKLCDPDLELKRILIPNKDWQEGSAHVNALIARLIEEHSASSSSDEVKWNELQWADEPKDRAVGLPTPETVVPEQQPAPIEAVVARDRIVRSHRALENVGLDVSAMHRVLISEARVLGARLDRQVPDARDSLNALVQELGPEITETQIYGVGYWYDVLLRISYRVDEAVLDDAAGRFAGFMVNLDRFLKQSPEWNSYVRSAQNTELQALTGSAEEAGTPEIIEAFDSEDKLVGDDITGPLLALNRALLEAPMYNPETAYGFYRSLANVLQAVVELALSEGLDAISSFSADVSKELRKKSVAAVATSIIAGIGYQLLAFVGAVPSMFGFLQPILRLIGIG
ncbi:MAG: hypothetical protein AAGL24_18775 [Pseudomonadota bacterium]